MRIGLYSREWQMAMEEARCGLAGLGHDCHWRRHSVYAPGDVEPFDLVLTVGFKGPGALIASDYRRRGIPVIVMDIPSVPTPPGGSLWRLSLGGHDWLFPSGPGFERAAKLGLGLFFAPGRRGSSVVVLGQTPGDAAHDLPSDAAVVKWAEGVVARCREQLDAPIVWRPHPSTPSLRPGGFDAVSLGPLEDTLRSAYAVVTISSGAGLVALRHGVPVVALGPCVYSHLAGDIKHLPRLKPPARDDVEDLFARLAYQHWSREELRDGSAMTLYLKLAFGEPVEWPKAPAPVPIDKPSEPTEVAPVESAASEKPKARRGRKKKAVA